jgi:hypothetical protein
MNARSATADRDAIRAAIDRLLAGTPLRSNGSLTIVALAGEANVKRHLLTHRHTDLRGRSGRLGPFLDQAEDSGLFLRHDLPVDQAFQLRSGAFDVFR